MSLNVSLNVSLHTSLAAGTSPQHSQPPQRVARNSQVNRVVILTLSVMALICSACEEEVNSSPRRGVRRPAAASNTASAQLTRYQSAGNGPQLAPDWVKSLDPNMMRRSNTPLEGFRYGHAFNPSVVIERGEEGWRLTLTERPLSSPSELFHQGQVVTLPFKAEPTAQLKQSADFEVGDAQWRLPKSATPGDTTLWTAQSAYRLELISWKVSPYDQAGPSTQEAGRASGRLMLRCKDEAGVEGWVVGRFDNALVRYIGDPARWAEVR